MEASGVLKLGHCGGLERETPFGNGSGGNRRKRVAYGVVLSIKY
jgi:hypothetical protein